jgi:hypothetical protein
MLRASSVVSRSCRRRGTSRYCLHPLLLVGAADAEASVHAASIAAGRSCRRRVCRSCRRRGLSTCMHGCLQVPPQARRQRMPLVCSAAGRSRRRRGASTRRLLSSLRAAAAAGEASARFAAIHCYWQELPPARSQRMWPACIVAGRSCRRRGTSAGRLHPLLLVGAAAGEASAYAACLHCCRREPPVA